jgi:2-polyprenyl-3-methyl-5-hydroxy-6-metoxy-1,4-benzoquinol methylase
VKAAMLLKKTVLTKTIVDDSARPCPSEDRRQRWMDELAFFNETATVSVSRTPERIVQRYQHPRGKTALEHAFKVAGTVQGKNVLDLACGSGSSSTLLALLGARVTGVDLSPKLIHAARERAVLDGVTDRCRFICSPLEVAEFEGNQFDLVWCECSIHHVIPDIELVMHRLRAWTKTDGLIIINEPLNHFPWLRRVRLATSVAINGTRNERPLEKPEIELIRSNLRDVSVRYFRLFTRVERLWFENVWFERAAWWKRCLFRVAECMDIVATRVPKIRSSASTIVICGRPRKEIEE